MLRDTSGCFRVSEALEIESTRPIQDRVQEYRPIIENGRYVGLEEVEE